MDYEQLGRIMLNSVLKDEVEEAYGTTDPYWVGRYALQYNDINKDGTLN